MPGVRDDEDRLEPAEHAVGPPELGQLGRGARDVVRIVLELAFESLEEGEAIGRRPGEADQDLPVEESESLLNRATDAGLKLIQLITPTTPRDRAAKIAGLSTGFIYYVSVAGLTGERRELPTDLTDNVAWLRTQTDLPICVGFGISSPEHVRQLLPVADGLIVGSAIVRRLEAAGKRPSAEVVREIGEFVGTLVQAFDGEPRSR